MSDLLNKATRELPPGWAIVCRVQRGIAVIELIDQASDEEIRVDFLEPGTGEQNAEQRFTTAIEFAKKAGPR